MKRNRYALLFLVLVLVVLGIKAFSLKGAFPKKPSVFDSVNLNVTSAPLGRPKPTGIYTPENLNDFSVQAWIYPGTPSCNAMKELSDGRKIDVLKPGYFAIDENGNVILLTEEEYGCNGFSKENVTTLQKYSSHQIVVVSANHINMRVLFADSNKISDAINKLVDFVAKNRFSGVEVDFEDFSSWTENDYINYKNFIIGLTQVLHSGQKLVVVDGPVITPITQKDYKWKYSDFDKMPVDYVLLMSYDNQYDGGKGSFIAPNEWVKETVTYVLSQVDNKKLIVGVPSYGYHSNSKNQIILDTQEQSMGYPGSFGAKISSESFEYYWREGNDFYVMQKKEGLAKKVNFIKSFGIQNFSVWHLGGNPWFE